MKRSVYLIPLIFVALLTQVVASAQNRGDLSVKEYQQRIDSLYGAGDYTAAIECGLEAGNYSYEIGLIRTATAFYSIAERTAADNGLKNKLLQVYETLYGYNERRGAYKAANVYLKSYYELRDELAAEAALKAEAEELEAAIAAEKAAAAEAAAAPNPFIVYYVIIGALALLYVVAAVISSCKRRRIRRQIVELEKRCDVNVAAPIEMSLMAERIRTTADAMLHNCRKEGFDFRTEAVPLLSQSRSLSLTASNIVACYEENYKPETVVVDIDKILKRSLKEFEPTARLKNVKIDYKSTGKATVKADEHLVGLAVDNLVDNAVKYSPSGTTVSLWIETVERKTIIGIEDRGNGIDGAKIKAMLQGEAFEVTEGTDGVKGLGLGLIVCRKAAESSRAEFEILSSKEGTTVKFTFK